MYTKYFACLIFVGKGRRRKYLTAKISRSTVYTYNVTYHINNGKLSQRVVHHVDLATPLSYMYDTIQSLIDIRVL